MVSQLVIMGTLTSMYLTLDFEYPLHDNALQIAKSSKKFLHKHQGSKVTKETTSSLGTQTIDRRRCSFL